MLFEIVDIQLQQYQNMISKDKWITRCEEIPRR